MNQRLKENKNLTVYQAPNYEGLLIKPKYEYVKEYLSRCLRVLDKSLQAYNRLVILRFDLRFPSLGDVTDSPTFDIENSISLFFRNLKQELKVNTQNRLLAGGRVYSNQLRYVWARERDSSYYPHYHVCIFLNNDMYPGLGSFSGAEENMAARIKRSWYKALSIELHGKGELVHFSKFPSRRINRNSGSFLLDKSDFFESLSYLAKVNTKEFGVNQRSFGSSQS